MVQVEVFNEPDLQTSALVSPQGEMSLPLIGLVKIGGKKVSEATELIYQRYKKDYLVEPRIRVTITAFAKNRFTVYGEVAKPDSFEISRDQPVMLMQILAMAGGLTRMADKSQVKIYRSIDHQDSFFDIDISSGEKENMAARFALKTGDIVSVPYLKRSVTVLGEVEHPGVYLIDEGEPMDVFKAVAAAGGFTRLADQKKVTIFRIVDNKEQIIKVNMQNLTAIPGQSIKVYPNDVIKVGERFF